MLKRFGLAVAFMLLASGALFAQTRDHQRPRR